MEAVNTLFVTRRQEAKISIIVVLFRSVEEQIVK